MRVAREVKPPFFRCGLLSAVFLSAVFLFLYYQCVDFGPRGLTQRRRDAKAQRRRDAKAQRKRKREGEKRVYREAMRREGGIAAGGKGGE